MPAGAGPHYLPDLVSSLFSLHTLLFESHGLSGLLDVPWSHQTCSLLRAFALLFSLPGMLYFHIAAWFAPLLHSGLSQMAIRVLLFFFDESL